MKRNRELIVVLLSERELQEVKLNIGPTTIEDSYAEAFSMDFTRLIVTAHNQRWLNAAVAEFTGYGSSVIGCDAEVGLEQMLPPSETFDGRLGASLMVFGFSKDAVQKAVTNRVGQCLMTCPTTAVFNGLSADPESGQTSRKSPPASQPKLDLGNHLRYFGDGFQKSKLIGNRRLWRIPVMDGEFIIEDILGVSSGVAGGNFLIYSLDQVTGLAAAERAVDALAPLPNIITPFPGGVVRSGSKVGSRYEALRASTSHTFCPTLRGRVNSELPPSVNCVYEIVIDGVDFDSVANAICIGIRAASGDGIIAINAANYGGKLGKHHFHLHPLLAQTD